jgi:hypothetical protein
MKYKELLYDSTGTMKNFSVILGELETLFNGASTETIQHDLPCCISIAALTSPFRLCWVCPVC